MIILHIFPHSNKLLCVGVWTTSSTTSENDVNETRVVLVSSFGTAGLCLFLFLCVNLRRETRLKPQTQLFDVIQNDNVMLDRFINFSVIISRHLSVRWYRFLNFCFLAINHAYYYFSYLFTQSSSVDDFDSPKNMK